MPLASRKKAVSICARLLVVARERRRDYRLVLHSYIIERLLSRLSLSRHKDRLVLRGGVLLSAWLGDATRCGTRLELLSRDAAETGIIPDSLHEILSPNEDGIDFAVGTPKAMFAPGRSGAAGISIDIASVLENARLAVSIDVCFGDVVFPGPGEVLYPTLLGDPAPRLRCNRPETAVAEALQHIVVGRTELPDLITLRDVFLLIRRFDFEARPLARSIYTTFRRRATVLPASLPAVLSLSRGRLRGCQARWRLLQATDPLLKDVDLVSDCLPVIASFVEPVLEAIAGTAFSLGRWQAGGPWSRPSPRRAPEKGPGGGTHQPHNPQKSVRAKSAT
ncbi:MAG: nucleotidyl transferase AbiEii/AbiGii toxin family protein, partial [Alphaproteobacteria bacterium]|nr:nucleotidyl transferase AbiEii/AbiGii toxin family protein [Alphaproteobacteria bacterium]